MPMRDKLPGILGLRPNPLDRSLIQRLHARITRRTCCPDQAEDVVQDSYLRFAQRDAGEIRNPESYLLRVARNLVIDRSRSTVLIEPTPVDDLLPSPDPSPERVLLGKEHLRRVMQIADQLPPRCRDVFLLRKVEGWEQHEIAAHLNISVNMVQKHLRKALADISAALDAEDD
jgi:RNA polymerase sigma factor (sigma-70 family)